MLQPKRTKFRKVHKGRNRGLAQNGNAVEFGQYGLKATTRGQLTAREIEAARRTMTRSIKREGQVWIRIFPDKPITEKALGVRQGKGKGNVEYWVAVIQPGKILYEMGGVGEAEARHAFELAAAKLSVYFIMKAKEFREMSVEELNAELLKLAKQELLLKMANKVGQLQQTHKISQTRRDIARVKTVLTEKAGK